MLLSQSQEEPVHLLPQLPDLPGQVLLALLQPVLPVLLPQELLLPPPDDDSLGGLDHLLAHRLQGEEVTKRTLQQEDIQTKY